MATTTNTTTGFSVYVQKTNGGGQDITEMLNGITWSGDYKQVSRKLEFDVLYAIHDKNQPSFVPDVGDKVAMSYNDANVFTGVVWDRDLTSKGQFIKITCMDYMVYINKSTVSFNFKETTAEDICSQVCSSLGLPVGSMVSTGVKINLPAIHMNAYDVIMAAYTKAAATTGKIYMPTFTESGVAVIEKGTKKISLELSYDTNIEGTQFTETLDSMVSQIIVLDDKGNIVNTVNNSSWVQAYGIIQDAVETTEKDKDMSTVAQNALKPVEKRANVEALGCIDAITGNAVTVVDQHSGLNGLFYIDGDSHTFKNNVYEMKLTLAFENTMDNKSASTQNDNGDTTTTPNTEDKSTKVDTSWLDNWEVDNNGNPIQPN